MCETYEQVSTICIDFEKKYKYKIMMAPLKPLQTMTLTFKGDFEGQDHILAA